MISVIVPTMWLANEYFFKMIPFLQSKSNVKEIIIIDNNPSAAPKNLSDFPKIQHHASDGNLFFNASINLGVEKATGDILFFLNDDVIFDPAVLDFVCNNITTDMGILSPHPAYFNQPNKNEEWIQKLELKENTKTLDGFGCAMFIQKQNYYPVPKELTHHHGDEFLYRMQIKNGRKNYYIHNWVIVTPMRVTTLKVPEVSQVIERDWATYKTVFNEYGILNGSDI